MVLKRLLGRAVGPEAFVQGIVIVVDALALPIAMAFDAEVVVALHRQATLAIATLQHPLRKRNTGGNAMLLHLLDGQLTIRLCVGLSCLMLCKGRLDPGWEQGQQEQTNQRNMHL